MDGMAAQEAAICSTSKKRSFYEEFIDILDRGDGKLGVVDIAALMMTFVFSVLFLVAVCVFTIQLYLCFVGEESLPQLLEYSIPLTQVTGTLVTLVYLVAFMYSGNTVPPEEDYAHVFFDFDKDGHLGLVDLLCTGTGAVHAAVLVMNVVLWYRGAMPTSRVVECVAATTKLVILFLTKSYLAYQAGPKELPGYYFIFDINQVSRGTSHCIAVWMRCAVL